MTPARAVLLAVPALASLVLAGCATGTAGTPHTSPVTSAAGASGAPATGSAAAPTSSVPSSSTPSGPTTIVHVSSLEGDGETYGVGMPIVLRFTPSPTDSTAFTKAAKVTVDGQPANGAWYWEKPFKGGPIEAHYRPKQYWPANSTIRLDLPIKGLSAGAGLAYDGKLSSVEFHTGDAHVSRVNAQTRRMTVTSNGRTVKTVKVSLGAAKTPTYNGVKVVMQKGENLPGSSKLRPKGAVIMQGPGYGPELVNWSVRITTSGEYVHAAPWNSNIGRASTSNGCTNLSTADAEWFYKFSLIGDVVTYTGTDGRPMPILDGYGDWNVPWGTWAQGGLLLNH